MNDNSKISALTQRISRWVMRRFGRKCLLDPKERAVRLLEEALELAQAEDIGLETVSATALYVYGRPKGERSQEAAGVAVCLLAYCRARHLSFLRIADKEVTRIEHVAPHISQAKHAAKAHAGIAVPGAQP